MLDFVATLPQPAPAIAEYFTQTPGEMYGTLTQFVVAKSLPAAPRDEHAEAASTNKVFQFDTTDSPEHVSLHRLRRFKTFAANWDAEHAATPNVAAIDSAIILLSLMASHGISPKVALTSDGFPMLLFSKDGIDGEVTVGKDNLLEYYLDTPEGDGDSDIVFDGRTLPESLLGLIRA